MRVHDECVGEPAWAPVIPFEEFFPIEVDEVFVGPPDLDPSWSCA